MLQPMADQHRNSSFKRLSRAATAACVALMLTAAGAQHAVAQEMEEDSFETRILKSLLGLEDRPAIEYRERSPLVVPPTANLPPPKTSALASDPAWPKDADLQPKKKTKASAATPKTYEGWNSEGSPLTPYELERGRRAGAGLTPTNSTDAERGAPLRPDQLGYKGGLFGKLFGTTEKNEVSAFTGEPPRTNLTAPPVGYQTPSPDQPYGLSAKKEAPKPFKLEDRGTTYD
jgi:hypothetical protein